MNEDKKIIKVIKQVYPQIYSYILPTVAENNGWQKIGYTERQNVDDRIIEQTKTAAINLPYTKLWSASAIYEPPENGKFFTDKPFHRFLQRNGVRKDEGHGEEWFYFNGDQTKSKEMFANFTERRELTLQGKAPYELRDEQGDAVQMTLDYAATHQTTDFDHPNSEAEFLWNAKPRFGKTLTTYDFAKQFKARNVLIVTNRPAIANSWYDDFQKFIDGYHFISTADSLKERKTLTREEFNQIPDMDKKQITFLSLQDLKGARVFGGGYNKLQYVADLKWDLLVIDEAHEGVDTNKTAIAFEKINRRFTLHLSGTPFKALANNKFKESQIYNWSYVDEQQTKTAELASGDESAPHADMPDLRLFTYRLSDMIADRVNRGMTDGDETLDFTFDLNEFFATKNGAFVHQKDVLKFLDVLATNQKYPFSTPELRAELKHTFWLVGNRVSSAKALEKLLRKHPAFQEYEVVLAAGDGKRLTDDNDFEDELENTVQNEKAFDRVRKAIKQHDKTITLSVGQLTTGVTIPEWSGVLMLSDINTPSLYMQAAFRAQNPYKFYQNGNLQRKKSAYIFDFAPTRVLTIFDDFANSLLSATANGQSTTIERTENVAKLLNFFPVISEDRDGKMIELDASQVLTFPRAIKAQAIVNSGFISNLLFTNISNIFSIPREVIDTLEKMDTDRGKRNRKPSVPIDHDKLRQNGEMIINTNTDAIFGDKVYSSEIMSIVETATSAGATDQLADMVNDQVMAPIYAKHKEVYQSTEKELDEAKKFVTEKVQNVVDEYNNLPPEAQDTTALANNIAKVVEQDAPEKMVVEKEETRIATEQATEEEKVRGHLRAFARTIPSFIMANSHPETLTIDNLTDEITEEDFESLTSITKPEFERLRDGFDYEENGQAKHFDGLFDKFIFNASIQEFEDKRKRLANYFTANQTEDIFDYIPPQKTNQIFTPRTLVQKQLDILEQETPGIFTNPNTTFADLYIKSGLYITEMVKRLFTGLAQQIPDETTRLKHILENQVYGFAPTKIIHDIATNFIFGELPANISRQNFRHHDLTKQFEKGEQLYMKFDVIIGNPPYQEETKDTSDKPIYNLFMDGAYKLSGKVCFITPARFLFNAGKTPKKWNKKMLSDEHLKVAYYEQNSASVFPNTDIKGGVAITYRDTTKNFGEIGTFTHFDELNDILRKLINHGFRSIDEIYHSQNKFVLNNLYEDHPGYVHTIGSDGKEKRLTSPIFEQLDIFTDRPSSKDDLKILGVIKNRRVYRYIKKDYLERHSNLKKYKVILPGSNGSGAIGEVLSTPLIGEPLIGEPLIGHTQTFISFGAFDNRAEAENLLKYIKSKFARAMLGTLKITQSNKKDTWRNVPLQDFTPNSDIDWSKSIAEIDQQLYRKYKLDQHEIDFIEEKVKEMK
ncbi:helicase [Candidatus Saccharibacteria bacterium]|nr:helicase [Candidatus Saccharibacteria bacterium]